MSREELLASVEAFPWWHQRIYLGQDVFTRSAPSLSEQVWEHLAPLVPRDLEGLSVLDVGCNAGFFSIEMKRRNAGRVVGIDTSEECLRQASLCAGVWRAQLELRLLDAHDISRLDENFDVVLFMGILYHLKSPLSVLEDVARVCRDAIVVESEVIADDPRNRVYVNWGPLGHVAIVERRHGLMKFVEGDELNSDPTNWWIPDRECLLGMLRVAGFRNVLARVDLAPSRVLLLASKTEDSVFSRA